MRHADDDVLHAQRAAALDDLLQRRDHGSRRRPGRSAWCRGSGWCRKRLEALGLDQLLEDGDLALLGEGDLLVAALDALLQPGLLLGVGDVHVLHADVAAVGAAQDLQDLAERRGLQPQHEVEEDRPVEVGLGEAVGRRVEFGGVARRGGDAQRIEVGLQVAAHPVGADHHDGAQGIQGGGADRRRRLAARAAARSAILAPSLASTAGHRPSMAESQSGRAAGAGLGSRPARPRRAAPRRRCRAGWRRRRARTARPNSGRPPISHRGLPRRPRCRRRGRRSRPRTSLIRPASSAMSSAFPEPGRGASDERSRARTAPYAKSAPQAPFSTSSRVSPSFAGDGETRMPAASIAAILSSAPPLPPEMIAPA